MKYVYNVLSNGGIMSINELIKNEYLLSILRGHSGPIVVEGKTFATVEVLLEESKEKNK